VAPQSEVWTEDTPECDGLSSAPARWYLTAGSAHAPGRSDARHSRLRHRTRRTWTAPALPDRSAGSAYRVPPTCRFVSRVARVGAGQRPTVTIRPEHRTVNSGHPERSQADSPPDRRRGSGFACLDGLDGATVAGLRARRPDDGALRWLSPRTVGHAWRLAGLCRVRSQPRGPPCSDSCRSSFWSALVVLSSFPG
jgi:hypothetical protein